MMNNMEKFSLWVIENVIYIVMLMCILPLIAFGVVGSAVSFILIMPVIIASFTYLEKKGYVFGSTEEEEV